MTSVLRHIRTPVLLPVQKFGSCQLKCEIDGEIISACLVCEDGEIALFKHWNRLVPGRYLSSPQNRQSKETS